MSQDTPSWAKTLLSSAKQRHAAQVAPFDVIDSYCALRDQYAVLSQEFGVVKNDRDRAVESLRQRDEEMATLRLAAQGLVLHSAREKELEDRLSAMSNQLTAALEQTNNMLKIEHALREKTTQYDTLVAAKTKSDLRCQELEAEVAQQTHVGTLIKRELDALRVENELQRQQFANARDENDRLLPQILTFKQREAELHNLVAELEQQLIAASHGGGPTGPKPTRDLVFTDPEATLMTTCVAPSYVAHSVDDAHTGDIHAVTITETGRNIWTGGADKVLKGWDTSNGNAVGKVGTPASTLCLDSRSSYLVAGSVDCTCRVWHVPTMRSQCQLTGHADAVNAVCLTYDAQRVFTASRDCTIKSWDLPRSALQFTSLCAVACYDLAVSSDRICTAHFDNTIRLWDIRTGKGAGDVRDLHEKAVTSVRITPDNLQAVTLSRDNTIKVVDLRMLKEVNKLSDPRLTIASNLVRIGLSPDGVFCAVGGQSGVVAVFNLRDASSAPKLLTKGHSAAVMCCAWSPDGRGLATVGLDKRVIFWR